MGEGGSNNSVYMPDIPDISEVIPRGKYLGPPGFEPRTPA